jgi:hypothetical protein
MMRSRRSDDDAQNIALTEPVQPVLGEGRVVGNGVIEIEPARWSFTSSHSFLSERMPKQ